MLKILGDFQIERIFEIPYVPDNTEEMDVRNIPGKLFSFNLNSKSIHVNFSKIQFLQKNSYQTSVKQSPFWIILGGGNLLFLSFLALCLGNATEKPGKKFY